MTRQRYHFISGLPRSGSTLLSSILSQNPKFYADISSPLARFVRAIVVESHAGPGYKLQCDENRRIELIRGLVQTYHYDKPQEVCFNTNRGWTALVDLLAISHPKSKIICCVRDLVWILDSFEQLFRKNPFSLSSMYSSQEIETVYSRTHALMSPGHTVRFAFDCFKEAITGNNRHNLFILEYNQLCSDPEMILKSLYNFIDEPYFEHDFSSLESSYDVYDDDANIKGLHTIRKELKLKERNPILPPDLIQQYSNLEVWR